MSRMITPGNESIMSCLIILLFHVAIAIVDAAPPRTALAAKILPTCFPTRPYCIRPRIEECRKAISLMGVADPGYPIIVGRPDVVKGKSHSYSVPHAWASVPVNCVVKIDVTDPKATDEVTLISLTALAEVVIKNCILGGTGCGGSILAGKSKVLELILAYYTAIPHEGRLLSTASNGTILTHVDV